MRRRIVWTTAALAVLLVLPAVPATAAQSTLISPEGDVTEATPLEVQLERDFGAERFSEVHASLNREGERLGDRIQLECAEGCDPTDEIVLFVPPGAEKLDPTTGGPFGAEAPLANGTYVLQVELLKNSNFQSDETFEHEIVLAVRPTAPGDLAAEVDGSKVELRWVRSPEPDVEDYRVERHDGDDWEVVTTTSGAVVVDDPGAGEHRYRVVAERPDGRGGTLERASEEVTAEVEDDATDEDREGEESEDGDEDERDRDESDDESDGQTEDDADDGSSDERRGGSSSGGSTRAPSTGNGGSGSVPSLDDGGSGDGNGDGDGDGASEDDFSQELDYGDADDRAAGDVQVATPSGWRGTVDRIFDAERVAVPIATGLVMTATGLHLWRWLRIPV